MNSQLKVMWQALQHHTTNILGMWVGYTVAVGLCGALLGWSGSYERVALVAIVPTAVTSLVWWVRKGQHDDRR